MLSRISRSIDFGSGFERNALTATSVEAAQPSYYQTVEESHQITEAPLLFNNHTIAVTIPQRESDRTSSSQDVFETSAMDQRDSSRRGQNSFSVSSFSALNGRSIEDLRRKVEQAEHHYYEAQLKTQDYQHQIKEAHNEKVNQSGRALQNVLKETFTKGLIVTPEEQEQLMKDWDHAIHAGHEVINSLLSTDNFVLVQRARQQEELAYRTMTQQKNALNKLEQEEMKTNVAPAATATSLKNNTKSLPVESSSLLASANKTFEKKRYGSLE